ncbi:hypothetical protein HOLleu_13058 [Holothuria leucospilota]|uniref:Uncharacterized protein n=1 Tax=Holothuria leucospilota TaxID=206669 RepID=A0A9Q1CAC2_HOLLE|nr:hypothetical protein HOLleu_13058 [Holothuria leucospilota]
MGLNQSKLLELSLSLATVIALSCKVTLCILGNPRLSANELLLRSHHNDCCLEKPLVPQHFNDGKDENPLKNSQEPISLTFTGQDFENRTAEETHRENIAVIGIQCDPSPKKLVNTEVQCDHTSEETGDIITMKLKLAHANIYMLKKHFEGELSRQIGADLDVALYRSSELGNYLIVRGDTSDMAACITFCEKRYQGEVVKKSLLPDELYIEKGVSWMKVVAKSNI